MTVQKVQVKYYLFADLNQTFPLHINLKHSLTTTLIQTGTFHTRLQGHDDMCVHVISTTGLKVLHGTMLYFRHHTFTRSRLTGCV